MELKQICIDQQEDHIYINDYKILKKHIQGSTTTCFKSEKNGKYFAILVLLNQHYAVNKLHSNIQLGKYQNVISVIEYAISPTIVRKYKYLPYECGIFQNDNIIMMVQDFVEYEQLNPQIFKDLNGQINVIALLNFILQLIKQVQVFHQNNYFHFDIKPENILICPETFKFYIIDCGSVQHVTRTPKILLDACIDQNDTYITHSYQNTPLFSPSKYDLLEGLLICDKFDCYSIGCIIYYVLTSDYIEKAVVKQKQLIRQLAKKYGVLVTDLIIGLTHNDAALRYSLSLAIQHPVFARFNRQTEVSDGENSKVFKQQVQATILPHSEQIHLVNQFHLQRNTELRKIMFKNMKKFVPNSLRSQSTHKVQMLNQVKFLKDDHSFLGFQNMMRLNTFQRIKEQLPYIVLDNITLSQKYFSEDEFFSSTQLKWIFKSYISRDIYLQNWDCELIQSFKSIILENEQQFEYSNSQQLYPTRSSIIIKSQKKQKKVFNLNSFLYEIDIGELNDIFDLDNGTQISVTIDE